MSQLQPDEHIRAGQIALKDGWRLAVLKCRGFDKQPKILKLGRINKGFMADGVFSALGIVGTVLTGNAANILVDKGGDYSLSTVSKDDVILVRQATRKGYIECVAKGVARVSYPNSTTKRGRVQEHGMISPTILTSMDICCLESLLRIRRLTPRECFRLMGFTDDDFNKAKATGVSDSQLYKQAGNSIVVDVLFHIFLNLYEAMPYLFADVQLASFFTGIGAFEKAFKRLQDVVNQ